MSPEPRLPALADVGIGREAVPVIIRDALMQVLMHEPTTGPMRLSHGGPKA